MSGFPEGICSIPWLPLPGCQRRTPDELRILNLNAGGGFGNMVYQSDGMDPGDVDELAQRIADGDADVATLQEVWEMDLPELERQLERLTGDEWDLHFAEASTKARADDDWAGTVYFDRSFGNVVAVRRGDGVIASELVGTQKLDAPGDDGSDGRVAISVRVYTENGGTVDVVTAHTDYGGVGDEARAQQIEDLRRFAEAGADGGPVIITGDLNATRSGGEPVNEAIDGLVTEHGYTDAGDVGPTSDYGHGRRIDFIFTSDGIGVGTPERVQGDSPDKEGEDRDLSDHDGMVVDVEIPVPADGGGDPRV